MTRCGSRTLGRGAAVLALVGGAACARAQNQLDRPLDRNLQQGSGGMNAARTSLADELRFRNAVVTGNAPGGFSFRGNVGYRAPGEFIGSLGSNDTFSFRRDSFVSGLGGLGIRGTDALQYQFAMTTGNAPPSAFNGMPVLRRSGSGEISANVGAPAGEREKRVGAFSTGVLEGGFAGVRQTSSYTSNRVFQPTIIGAMPGDDGRPVGVTASPLRGINTTSLPEAGSEGMRPDAEQGQAGRTGGAEAGTLRNPLGLPEENPSNNPQAAPAREEPRPGLVVPNRAEPEPASSRADTRIKTGVPSERNSYQIVLERMRGPAPEDPAQAARTPEGTRPGERAAADGRRDTDPSRPDFDQRMGDLRETLAGRTPRSRRAQESGPTTPGEGLRPKGAPGAAQAGAAEHAASPNKEGEEEGPDANDLARRKGTIEMLRRAGQVGTLAPPGFDAYATAMKQGQDLLAAARYFDAEERFTTALGVRQGDPMAAAGRVHAELGSAMFLSAALNLRELLTQHPEMVGVRYAPELLPSKDRTEKVIDRLKELLSSPGGRSRDIGLLLAYLGHQSGNAAAERQGLEAMLAEGGDPENRRLGELLRDVWAAPAPAAEPKGEPPPPAPAKPAAPPSK